MTIVLLIILVLALLLLTGGYAAFLLGIVRLPREREPDPGRSKWLAPFRQEILDGGAWFREQKPERVSIPSFDGLTLTGYFLPAEDAKGTLLLVHGYRSGPFTDFGVVFSYYHDLGWNILAPWQRAHGESEGRYITFGVKERFDVRDWARYLCDRFGPEHAIVLDGISMGCTSVLMALGTELPGSVRGAIADCGFTSPRDEFVHFLKHRCHLPPHPIMDVAEGFARLLAGFGFRDYSTLDALKVSTLPVLFVHGERDTFVLPEFTRQNYAACRGEKRLVTVPNAGHGTSYLFGREECRAALETFLGECAAET